MPQTNNPIIDIQKENGIDIDSVLHFVSNNGENDLYPIFEAKWKGYSVFSVHTIIDGQAHFAIQKDDAVRYATKEEVQEILKVLPEEEE